MSERIDIANIALGMLGIPAITALTDDSDAARLMQLNYDIARDATLETHEWTFAIEYFVPAKDATAPTWGYANRFIIPSNILRVLSVGPNKDVWWEYEQDKWESVSGYIYANEEAIYCRGIRRINDEGIYSNLFCHAFAAKLATLTAFSLTESRAKMETMAALFTAMIMDAKSRDGLQGKSRRIRHRRYLNVR